MVVWAWRSVQGREIKKEKQRGQGLEEQGRGGMKGGHGGRRERLKAIYASRRVVFGQSTDFVPNRASTNMQRGVPI